MTYGWPLDQGSYRSESGLVIPTASLPGVVVLGAAPVKGAYAQYIASTAFDTAWVQIQIGSHFSPNALSYIIDLAVGPAASEVDVLPNMYGSTRQITNGLFNTFLFPFFIPAGSRIALRGAGSAANAIVVNLKLFSADFLYPSPATRAETTGVTVATALGTQVDPGGTINTKGAYSQITAATTFPYTGFVLFVGGNEEPALPTNIFWLLDVALGAAASERVIVPDIGISGAATYNDVGPTAFYYPCHVPAGERIAIRTQCNNATAGQRILTTAVMGVTN